MQFLAALLLSFAISAPVSADEIEKGDRRPTNKGVDLQSHGRQFADQVRRLESTVSSEAAAAGLVDLGSAGGREEEDRCEKEDRCERCKREDRCEKEGNNVQANTPALDHLQIVPGTRPFEFSIQSETSIASFRDSIVIGYNSTADQGVVPTGAGFFAHLSAFSVSHDGGRTWASGFVPPVPGSPFTFGDPSVGVDRAGHFYYVSLGVDANAPIFTTAVIINKSTDKPTDARATFAPATVVARDPGSDKPWLAVGPDPAHKRQDNLYVAWTSFQAGGGAELRFARSTDGGATWSPQRTLFAPVDGGPSGMSPFIQFANPTVDQSTGRLFIPFLHLGNLDTDLIRVLVSDDAGDTFAFLEFDVPGAPDKAGVPNVTPGTLSDCGPTGGVRPVLSQGMNLGGGRFGLPRFRQSTRLITQPSAAAARGKLFIAFNSSTSAFFGDPNSRSEIRLVFSTDGGRTLFGPLTVAAATDADPRHVLPSLSMDKDGDDVSVAYYVQQADGRVRVDVTRGEIEHEGRRFRAKPPARVSRVSFDLVPSNNPFPGEFDPFFTTNYDRTVAACYNLGEYLGITQADEGVFAAWGDNRNMWRAPSGSPAPGTHSQTDIFFQRIER
jgi:hypothetical protein